MVHRATTKRGRWRRLALPLLIAAPLLGACRQGVGDRCQVNSDCDEGLICALPLGGMLADGGTCQAGPPDGGADAAVTPDMAGADLPEAMDGMDLQTGGPDLTEAPDLTSGPDLTVATDAELPDGSAAD